MKLTKSPTLFFLTTAFLFGLIYVFIIPPFQVPDEGHHYYRAYHLSNGHVFGDKIGGPRFGGKIPESMVRFENDFRFLRYNYNESTDYQSITNNFNTPLEKEKTVFADFPNVAYYAPFPYLPQAFGFVIGKLTNSSPLTLLYLTRILGFLVWIGIIYLGLKFVPFHKWTFAAIALLPSSLFLHSGMIADSMTNGLCFLQVAFILKLAFEKKEITHLDFFFLLLISIISTVNKVIYLPILFLLFFIPKNKFKPIFSKHKFIGGILITNVIVLFFWYLFLSGTFISYENYHPDFRENVQLNPGVNPNSQIEFILQNPIEFLKIAAQSHIDYAPASLVHCIGKFGWEKNYLPFWVIVILLLNTIWISTTERHRNVFLQKNHRWGLLGIAGIIVAIFTVVIYMQWSPVGNSEIYALGGRYYFPVLPLVFLVFKSNIFQRMNEEKILIFQTIIWTGLIVGIWSAIERYY